MTITEQALDLASGAAVDPEAMESPGLPVPDDPAAVSLFTAHRIDEVLHKLSHASQRMEAARSASGDLRQYHAARLAGHLKAALNAGHDLAANLRGHYAPESAELDAVAETVGLAGITDQALSLTGDGHGRHVPGTPDVYRHGFIPIGGTVLGKDGIRRPGGKGKPGGILTGPHPADQLTVVSSPRAVAKSMSGDDLKAADNELSRRAALLGKPGQQSKAQKAVRAELAGRGGAGGEGKALDAAIKSGVASRRAPGSSGATGAQGGTQVVTFKNGAQYIHKDFKDLDPKDQIVHRASASGADEPLTEEGKKLMVAREDLAAKVSAAIGAGAPPVTRDPASDTGFYQPAVAGKPAVEHFKGNARAKGVQAMYNSPEGMKIGLMDALTGHEDRHLGNVMITPEGKPVPIDHNDTWGSAGPDGTLFTDSPFAGALTERIDAGKSPFTAAGLDQVKAKIQALKPEFDAVPGGAGTKYYQATMAKLAQVREQVTAQQHAADGGNPVLLAKAVSDEARAATTAHLTETTLHELTHADRHAQAMLEGKPGTTEWSFNADHAEKHLAGAVEHAGKLGQHLRDNYPDVARWLNGLDEVTAGADEAGGKQDGEPQHARYSKGGGETIAAQMAAETITGQAGDALDRDPVALSRRMFSDDLIRDLGGDPEAQGLT